MITRIGLAPRLPGLSQQEFGEHWRSTHGDLALSIPGLRGYVQNHPVLDGAGRPLLANPGFDACAETFFDSVDSMLEGFASEHYQVAVQADEAKLIDKSGFFYAVCNRRELAGGEAGESSVKLLWFVCPLEGVAAGKLADAVGAEYASIVAEAGPLRHEVLVVDEGAHAGGRLPPFGVVDLLWFASAEGALDFLVSPIGTRARQSIAPLAFGGERLLSKPRRVR